MKTYIVNGLFVKGLEEKIRFDRAYLYVHKVGSVSWSLEVDEVEQIDTFVQAIRNKEHLNITFSAEYMNELSGNVMVKRVKNDSVELKGSGELKGFND
ncbi:MULTISPECIES: hypothetical protein [Bacillus cereus group]|uniref:hypothetical protein n=1 Tax=Bacillus cereus group TaxID=86661 RepID=UPI0007B6D78A|nr:hypothetical protein [Bacillus cereus]ANC07807.1 hypothetical protein WR47_12115 [Bacillus cereus]ANC13629.1 hypothetical protein WR51_12125 [Bacillus cereus]MDA1995285.1 hypothetical protein [Bacillus cereus]MDA2001307.1 hypothetical protein [Bacillus cereus]MDA3655095.1 hypothetical protein [Bacillus cereus]